MNGKRKRGNENFEARNEKQKFGEKAREAGSEARNHAKPKGFRNDNARLKTDNARSRNDNSRFGNEDFRASDSRLVFGVLPVLESLRANARRVEKIYVAEGAREKRLSEIFELARENNVLINKTTRENLSRMLAPDANHQGVIAVKAAADYVAADEIFDAAAENALLVVLDGVEDPRNLGAVLRSVEGAGADGVFIPERRAVGLTDTAAKSSAGAVEYVKIAKVANVNRLIEELKERNIWTIGTSADAKKDYTDWDWTQPSALVLGGEGKGLHRLTAEKCDVLVKIPMQGKIESLNVSVACGVILFEAVRQRVSSSKQTVSKRETAE